MHEITLANGRGVALVDEADAALVSVHRWYRHDVKGKSYARSKAGYLHRLLMGLERGQRAEVDHIDGDGLNCQRANMRVCSHAQNHQNRRAGYGVSQYRGVAWSKRRQRWVARVKLDGVTHWAGEHLREEDAAAAAAALRARLMPYATA
jgi:hypothetical protein